MPEYYGAGSSPPLSASAILGICDGLTGEIGRRQHIFSWLRAPGSPAGEWLPVDAYYPSRRLVVILGPSPHAPVFEELVPARGLRLLVLDVSALPADRGEATAIVERRVRALAAARLRRVEVGIGEAGRNGTSASASASASASRGSSARASVDRGAEPVRGPAAATSAPLATAFASLMRPAQSPGPAPVSSPRMAATERAERLLAARRAKSGEPPRPRVAPRPIVAGDAARLRGPAATPGLSSVLLGLALAAAMCAEVYLAVTGVALGSGQIVLALGLVLDACARALGALAATKIGRLDWAWGCVVIGSPLVAGFALFQRSGPVTEEPAPLGGVISVLAMVLIVLALLAALLGI